jgi:hypothetical protein
MVVAKRNAEPAMIFFRCSKGSLAVLMAGAILLAGGCVRSKAIITSDPPEATVTMNGVNLGTTPVEQPFTWYWYYEFVATKDGYAPTRKQERFRAPVYLWPGLDLVMEMMPFYVTDTKRVHLQMEEVDERPAPVIVGSVDGAVQTPMGSVQRDN